MVLFNSSRNHCWNAKILEQNVQNVLELYFILGCQAHRVCITKYKNNKKQVPCQVSFVIGILRVDAFCKEFWQNNHNLVPSVYIEWDGDWGGIWNLRIYSQWQFRLIILFHVLWEIKLSFFFFYFPAVKCGQLFRRACSMWWRLWVWKLRQKPCKSASMEKTGRQLPLWTYTVSWGGSGGFKKKLFFVDFVMERHLFSDDYICLHN